MLRLLVSILMLALAGAAVAEVPSLDEVRRALRESRYEEALEAIRERLAADPADTQTRFLKGVALAETQDADGAIREFSALTRDHPELPEPYNNLAVVYASQGDYETARDALEQAINTHPSYATAHENLGDIYAKMAGLAYTRALSLDTANAGAKQKLALIDDLFSRGAPPPAPSAVSAAVPLAAAVAPGAAPATPAVRVPAPPAAPPSAPAPPVEEGAVAAVQRWAAAWSAQDVARYLAAYAPGVSPEPGLARAEWERRRRVRVAKPAFIAVDVDRFEVRRVDAGRVSVTFEQRYRSDTYQDRVRKELLLREAADGWKIVSERTLEALS